MKVKEINKIARNKLSGNWAKAFAITAIFIAINFAITYCSMLTGNLAKNTPILSSAISIIFALILLVFSYGYISTMIKLINGKNPAYTNIINDSLLNCSKVIGIFFRTVLKMLIPSLIIVISAVAIFFLVSQAFPLNWDTLGGYILLAFFLYAVAGILISIVALPYSLSSYVLANENDLSAKEALEKSVTLMEGNKWNLVKQILSFFGWFLLIGIIAGLLQNASTLVNNIVTGIATIFILPYFISSISVFYDDLNDVVVETANTSNKESADSVETTDKVENADSTQNTDATDSAETDKSNENEKAEE